jgi:prophage maintenance system killer protein
LNLHQVDGGFCVYDRQLHIFSNTARFVGYVYCFKDDNKRTGYFVPSTFLNLNGYRVNVSNEELFNKCIENADKKSRPMLEDVEKWLEKILRHMIMI